VGQSLRGRAPGWLAQSGGRPADFQRLRAGLEEAVADRDVATMQGAHRRLLAHLQADV